MFNKYDGRVNLIKVHCSTDLKSRVLTYSNKSMVLKLAQRFIYGYVLVTGIFVCLLLI